MAVQVRRGTALAVAVTAVITLAMWSPATARAAREQTATYVGTSEPVVTATAAWSTGLRSDVACVPVEETPGVAGACFRVLPGESTVRVRIHDTVTPLVRGTLRFVDAGGEAIGKTIDFCRRLRADIPGGAVGVVVLVQPFACEPVNGRVPIAGRVVAYFE